MGGKYSVIGRQLDDSAWMFVWYGDSVAKFIINSIYALNHYEVCQIGIHGY